MSKIGIIFVYIIINNYQQLFSNTKIELPLQPFLYEHNNN